MARAYEALLCLYPADYRTRFAAEMLETFEEANAFSLTEVRGLLMGAICEWIAKLSTDPAVRGRCLPDLRMMRPPVVPQELWFAQSPKHPAKLPTLE